MRRHVVATAVLVTAAMALVACGGDDDDDADLAPATTAAPAGTETAGTETAGTADGATTVPGSTLQQGPPRVRPNEEAAACAQDKTLEPLELTIATGEPAFPPYVIDDDPENGQGFESAVAYAVAGAMGIGPAAVTWIRTPFEAAIQPGPKDFDFNIQQYSISPEREEVVSFSQSYYAGNQAILGYDDSPAATAETITDFQDLKIGVAAGTTSLNFVTDVLQPSSEPFVFNDNAAAKQALDTQQIDAIVADLPTALYISAVEIEGTTVFGQFPAVEGSEGEPWGMLFAKDNPLVECVNLALASLKDDGTLDQITEQWMTAGSGVPEISLE